MLASPPRRPEWASWALAVGCAIAIFCTIPLARDIQKWVDATLGRVAFTYGVLTIGGLTATWMIVRLVRTPLASKAGYAWIAASAGVLAWYTISLDTSPEEAVHFVEYGLLAVLLFSALSHRVHDATIYGAVLALGASVGIVDEGIQWVMPKRVWDLRDIGLNCLGVVLVVVPIALGIRPAFVKLAPTKTGVRWMTRSLAVAGVLFGFSLLNTPERIGAYATSIPGLGFLVENESMMIEYGHLYEDTELDVVFRSRFDRETLARIDRERAEEAAKVLDEYHHGKRYGAFLKVYTPLVDPFLHEARVHLFRRDHYHWHGLEAAKDDPKRREMLEIAFRENQIVERYFPESTKRSKFAFTDEQRAALEAEALKEPYESPVSRGLFTRISESVIIALLAALYLALLALNRRFGFWFVLAMAGCAAPKPSSSGEPSLDIVFYTDVHARTEWETPTAMMLAAEKIRAEKADLVISGGDVITDGFQSRPETVAPRWAAYEKMVAAIGKVEHVIGNHDLVAADPDDGSEPIADPRKKWREVAGVDRSYRSFDAGGYHFVFLDSIEVGGDLRYRGYVSKAQLDWISADLEKVEPGTPIVVGTHIPLLTNFYAATRGSTVAAPANRVVVNNREVIERFEGHDLVLVLQGHLHASEMLVWKGVTYLTGGALSAKWWRGPWMGTQEGYTRVRLRGRDVDWDYVDIDWEAKRPPSG